MPLNSESILTLVYFSTSTIENSSDLVEVAMKIQLITRRVAVIMLAKEYFSGQV